MSYTVDLKILEIIVSLHTGINDDKVRAETREGKTYIIKNPIILYYEKKVGISTIIGDLFALDCVRCCIDTNEYTPNKSFNDTVIVHFNSIDFLRYLGRVDKKP